MRRGLRRGWGRAGAAVGLAVVLAGCGADAAEPPPPEPVRSTASASASGTGTGTPTPKAVAPTLPQEATKATAEGASAFLRHYIDSANHAYATGDLEPLQNLRADECNACRDLEQIIIAGYQHGGRIEGATIKLDEVTVTPGHPDIGLEAALVMEQASGRAINGAGEVQEELPATSRSLFQFIVEYDGAWAVVEWGIP